MNVLKCPVFSVRKAVVYSENKMQHTIPYHKKKDSIHANADSDRNINILIEISELND